MGAIQCWDCGNLRSNNNVTPEGEIIFMCLECGDPTFELPDDADETLPPDPEWYRSSLEIEYFQTYHSWFEEGFGSLEELIDLVKYYHQEIKIGMMKNGT